MRNSPCCICGKWISNKSDDPATIGRIKQGSINAQFHLECLHEIRRGSNYGKTAQKETYK